MKMDSASWMGVIFGILVSVWANKRGYAWWAYILASPIIGVIALGILPNLSEPGKEFQNKEELVRKGNMTGMIISGFTLGFLMILGAMLSK
jgi:1,4-dihydroxy-2-naphthoate octaprenyltransferase